MSTIAIIAVVVVAVMLVLLVGGFVASRRRTESDDWSRHVAESDHALEAARASDKGWDRELMERAVRDGLQRERPGWAYAELHLVLVDDRPGVAEDKAHYVAQGADGDVRIVLARESSGEWRVDSVA